MTNREIEEIKVSKKVGHNVSVNEVDSKFQLQTHGNIVITLGTRKKQTLPSIIKDNIPILSDKIIHMPPICLQKRTHSSMGKRRGDEDLEMQKLIWSFDSPFESEKLQKKSTGREKKGSDAEDRRKTKTIKKARRPESEIGNVPIEHHDLFTEAKHGIL